MRKRLKAIVAISYIEVFDFINRFLRLLLHSMLNYPIPVDGKFWIC